ncbi:formate dehydrogenase accessory sulfurtransferase FdhD [Acuticoccus mangrovi]|uniref:Formate dehydrogenase accessory sulfurtransferase FdhD n=1 Tax=Acuticoccus mangrovi TaxID=2796142 RepID=A0A934IL90_9HYPH|nr:formate dehydrogenase accessory sulfurtransferase FdhD [Acuticoccus mangrovi]
MKHDDRSRTGSGDARCRHPALGGPLSAVATSHLSVRFEERFADGRSAVPRSREVPAETPVAIEFDGIGYAVMMATPVDLADFVTGFAIAERLLELGSPPPEVSLHDVAGGVIARAQLPDAGRARVFERARRRVAESSCGLCGLENLEEVLRPLPPVAAPLSLADAAIFAAGAALNGATPLGAATSAVHAAAICRPDGTLLFVREDVGRHNALDKAIGAFVRAGGEGDVFAFVSSRCSYELVEKAVMAGLGALVTISAPTSLAIDRAKRAGLPLYVLARADSVLAVG